MTAVLVLLNGLPGSGKSTLARAWCARRGDRLPLALDVDVLRAMIGGWRDRPIDAGLAARAAALAAARAHLDAGRDVIVPQFLLRPAFADQLAAVAAAAGAAWSELVVDVPLEVAAERLDARDSAAEGALESSLADLAVALDRFTAARPHVVRIGGPDPLAALDAEVRRVAVG